MGDTLYIGSCAGKFYAINKTSGQVRWLYDIGRDGKQRSFHGDPLIIDDLILIGTDYNCDPEGIGHLYAFERESGKVRWKYRSNSVATDIAQQGSILYFGNFQDEWSAIDFKTQRLKWSFTIRTPNTNCDLPKSPVTYKESVLILGLDGTTYSLEATTGRMRWQRKLAAAPSTWLAVREKDLYVGTTDNKIYRINADNGNVVGQMATDAKPFGRMTFIADSLVMFLENASEKSGYIISLDSQLRAVKWKQKSSPDWASIRPHVWKENIIAGNCRGEVAAFRASDGTPQWNLNVKGCIRAIGSSGNILFVGVQEGTVYAFEHRMKQ